MFYMHIWTFTNMTLFICDPALTSLNTSGLGMNAPICLVKPQNDQNGAFKSDGKSLLDCVLSISHSESDRETIFRYCLHPLGR